jgi:hypothetical protein
MARAHRPHKIAGVLGAIFVAALVFLCWPREPRLLDQAARVSDANYANWGRFKKYWLSSHELLTSGALDGDALVRRDLRSGTVTKLTALAQVHAAPSSIEDLLYPELVSPDGRWFLKDSGGSEWRMDVVSLEGDRRFHWSKAALPVRLPHYEDGVPLTIVLWMPDSLRWAQFVDAPHSYSVEPSAAKCLYVLMGDIRMPGKVHAIPVASTSPLNPFFASIFSYSKQGCDAVLLTQDRVLFCTVSSYDGQGSKAEISELDLQSNDRLLNHVAVTVPAYGMLQNMSIAPTGDHIAWVYRHDYVPPLAGLLHRLWPSYVIRPQSKTSLWISRSDGSHFHELGYVDTRTTADDALDLHPLQWLPDGKTLSFDHEGALWTLSCD